METLTLFNQKLFGGIKIDGIVSGFLKRNLPQFQNDILVEITGGTQDYFTVAAADEKLHVRANNYISAFHAIYCYLKKY